MVTAAPTEDFVTESQQISAHVFLMVNDTEHQQPDRVVDAALIYRDEFLHLPSCGERSSRGRVQSCLSIMCRLVTVRSADSIIVMDQGRIAEQGTHDELVAAGGIYAGLAARQGGAGHDMAPTLPEAVCDGAFSGFCVI